jgi:hypothetical protein
MEDQIWKGGFSFDLITYLYTDVLLAHWVLINDDQSPEMW